MKSQLLTVAYSHMPHFLHTFTGTHRPCSEILNSLYFLEFASLFHIVKPLLSAFPFTLNAHCPMSTEEHTLTFKTDQASSLLGNFVHQFPHCALSLQKNKALFSLSALYIPCKLPYLISTFYYAYMSADPYQSVSLRKATALCYQSLQQKAYHSA